MYQSTVGRALATLLGVPFIALDVLAWEPGWKAVPQDVIRKKVDAALAGAPSWVVDGNYPRLSDAGLNDNATDIIWLDPPLMVYFPRLLARTLLRIVGRAAPCSDGCPETLRGAFFSKDSIVLWCLSQHAPVRRRCAAMMGEETRRMRRIGGWGGELRAWLGEVEEMSTARAKNLDAQA